MLHPQRLNGATWFRHKNGITKSIMNMLHHRLPDMYPSYRDMPRERRESWFRTFAQDFNWDYRINLEVRRVFDKQASSQFSEDVYSRKQKWKKGKPKPRDLDPDVWEAYIRYWSTEEANAISARNRANRWSERDGLGVATHNAGAMTFESHADEQTAKAGGV